MTPIEGDTLASRYAGRSRCAGVCQSVRVAQQAAAAHPVIALDGFAAELTPRAILALRFASYLYPTRSSICCTLTWLPPMTLIGMVSDLKLPPVMACRAVLLTFTLATAGHSLLPLAK